MSVLIKGMEMPKGNPVTINIYRDGSWVNAYTTEDGKAIEVPTPHGRLIEEQWLKDAMITTLEALKKNPKMDRQEMHLIAAFDTLRAMLEDAPTIIEEENEI